VAKKRTGESLKALFKKEPPSKELKRQSSKALQPQKAKTPGREKYSIYLTKNQRKKIRLYAAKNDIALSDVIAKLIDEQL